MEALAVKQEFWNDGATAIGMLKSNIKECVDAGHFRKDLDLDVASLMLWSQVHGLVTLYTKERLNIYPAVDQQKLMFDAYELFFGAVKKCLS